MKRYQLLVIEDDEAIAESYEEALQSEGFEVILARDGEAGLRMLREAKRRPDLILLDLFMPGKDGYDFLEELNDEPGAFRIPLVVVTAFHQELLHSNIDVLLRKPVELEALFGAIRRFLPKDERER